MTSRSNVLSPYGRRSATTSPFNSVHGNPTGTSSSSKDMSNSMHSRSALTTPSRSALPGHQGSESKNKGDSSSSSLFNNSDSKTGNKSGGANAFNPKLILYQILAIQCFHYVFYGLIIQINHLFFGINITIDRIFTTNYLNFWSAEGWIDNSAVLLTFVFQAILLAIIVEKSRKCLDFSVTLFFFHFIFCSIYSRSIPHVLDWWIIHVLGLIIMVVLGEFLCSRRELMDIPLLAL